MSTLDLNDRRGGRAVRTTGKAYGDSWKQGESGLREMRPEREAEVQRAIEQVEAKRRAIS